MDELCGLQRSGFPDASEFCIEEAWELDLPLLCHEKEVVQSTGSSEFKMPPLCRIPCSKRNVFLIEIKFKKSYFSKIEDQK